LLTFALLLVGVSLLSFLSGMLGLGAAFATIPYLSFFFTDIVREVQILGLLINGFTAISSALGFLKSGYLSKKDALALVIITSAFAPIGSYLAYLTPVVYIWTIYILAVIYLSYKMWKGSGDQREEKLSRGNLSIAILFAIPISILAGLLGVGPGFLLLPTLIMSGYSVKLAAGINAVAVSLPSFTALIPRSKDFSLLFSSMPIKLTLLVLAVTITSYFGARVTARFIKPVTFKRVFVITILAMTLIKLVQMIS